MKILRKILGFSLFYIFNRINLRLIYKPVGDLIEKLRVDALNLAGAHIGKNSFVRAGTHIAFPANLIMGDHSKINDKSGLYLFEKLRIGNNVEIGPELLVYTGEHKIVDPSQPLTKQGNFNQPVTIGNDVYVGARVTILKGVTIEDRVVVAAGAVVTSDLKSGYIYGGVPAKQIKKLVE